MAVALAAVYLPTVATPAEARVASISGEQPLIEIPVHGTGTARALNPQEQQDADTLAAKSGGDVNEERAAARGQAEWDAAVERIAAALPDSFTSAGRDPQTGGNAWITLVRKPESDILDLLSRMPFDVTVKYGTPASEKTIAALGGAAVAAVGALPGLESAGDIIDPQTGAITIRYRLPHPGSLTSTVVAAAATKGAAAIVGLPLPVPIRVEEDPHWNPTPKYAGGVALWDNNTAKDFDCTSGFNVVDRSNGVTAATTAAHCDNYLLWGEQQQAGVISFQREASQIDTGKYVDMQLHRSLGSNVGSANFQATGLDSAGRRTVTSARNATLGDRVCKWGEGAIHSTVEDAHPNYDCSYVTHLNLCETYSQPVQRTYCGLAEISPAIFNPGDSGGPIFWGNEAKGIVSGADDYHNVDWFTPQTRYTESLNASIIIGN
jgi:streptogrisin C